MSMSQFKREPFITIAILLVGFVMIYFSIKYDIHRKSPPNLATFSIAGFVLGFFLRNIFIYFFVNSKDTLPDYPKVYTFLFALLGTVSGVLLCFYIAGTTQ